MKMSELSIENFNYELPESNIAQTPIEPRDSSRLLFYDNREINETVFSNLTNVLPLKSTLVFNDAKVIPARIFLKNIYQANIEVFLLKPYQQEYTISLNAKHETNWECLIGNKKKWHKNEELSLLIEDLKIDFNLISDQVVNIKWNQPISFIEVLSIVGKMPLPPYIKRSANKNDEGRYQTVYSKSPGSVAAPTAGLHFTENLLKELASRNVHQLNVTLHVSAGTFLPVKTDNIIEHAMHQEFISCDRLFIQNVVESSDNMIAVGTTSLRVLESLYWVGFKLINNLKYPLDIEQFVWQDHQEVEYKPTFQESYKAILDFMIHHQIQVLSAQTALMIMPGYHFNVIKGLITNFHQPKSTLLFLVAAFIGHEWKSIYNYAIQNNFRFLSYGDSSLLLR
jgi:S-adenosylmethionine:tRNA ribosyltransferase-isomerase